MWDLVEKQRPLHMQKPVEWQEEPCICFTKCNISFNKKAKDLLGLKAKDLVNFVTSKGMPNAIGIQVCITDQERVNGYTVSASGTTLFVVTNKFLKKKFEKYIGQTAIGRSNGDSRIFIFEFKD